ncbi:ABC transporter [Nocardioides sp. PD653]|nr:ABC transporter [Nocardioides sp. PD653-B2]GAW53508.1 ABC transporter [Nocardioides sp. PD653]
MSAADTLAPVLEVRGLTKAYGRVQAVRGIDLALRPGEICALLGENGAGKSTLIGMLSGVVSPTEGTMSVEGQPVSFGSASAAQAAGVSTVFQELSLARHLTVADNLFMGRMGPLWRLDAPRRRRERAREVLVGLGWDIDPAAPVGRLSAADQQLVEIARAIASDTKVLLLDEPTSSLAPQEVERLHDQMRALSAAGLAIVYVSHRMTEVFDVASTFAVLRDGRLSLRADTADTTPSAVMDALLGGAAAQTGSDRQVLGIEESAERPAPLELRGVGVSHVLHDIDLKIRWGEVTGLTGLRGSGAVELAEALFDRRGVSGQILVRGVDSSDDPRELMRRRIAYVPPERGSGLFPNLSLAENIELTARVGRRKSELTARDVIRRLSIKAENESVPIRTLSGGNQQKAMIGRWLLLQPEIFVLIEPTRGVDVGVRREIHELLWQFADDGMAVVVASADLEEIADLADRTVVLHEGRIVADLERVDVTTVNDAIAKAAVA